MVECLVQGEGRFNVTYSLTLCLHQMAKPDLIHFCNLNMLMDSEERLSVLELKSEPTFEWSIYCWQVRSVRHAWRTWAKCLLP